MRRLIFLALTACLTLAASSAAAHVRTGKLTGVVLQRSGAPAAGAEVMIERSNGSAPVAVRTDSNGRYLFNFVLAGYYDIRASRGHTTTAWKHNIIVHSGRKTIVDLRLEPIKTASAR